LIATVGYVPDGFTQEEWNKKKKAEQDIAKNKAFGAFGPRGFKSRSLQSFQMDLEKGKADHLLPVLNAKEKVRTGQIKLEDIPYMQRGNGASWDNSDVKGAKRKQWNEKDEAYRADESRDAVDWTGRNLRQGPKQTVANKEAVPGAPKKKMFGIF
jgi:hypothetical protein